ncbi:uncharacterized protein [Triticum aestivum]|uniref:uncharacterized protein n=1 Tax=Triticum aestivum TaxID=4565 RepID=UPI001D02F165|nr:uncharacterized protein LOC123099834 [Triticum aestivum]
MARPRPNQTTRGSRDPKPSIESVETDRIPSISSANSLPRPVEPSSKSSTLTSQVSLPELPSTANSGNYNPHPCPSVRLQSLLDALPLPDHLPSLQTLGFELASQTDLRCPKFLLRRISPLPHTAGSSAPHPPEDHRQRRRSNSTASPTESASFAVYATMASPPNAAPARHLGITGGCRRSAAAHARSRRRFPPASITRSVTSRNCQEL